MNLTYGHRILKDGGLALLPKLGDPTSKLIGNRRRLSPARKLRCRFETVAARTVLAPDHGNCYPDLVFGER